MKKKNYFYQLGYGGIEAFLAAVVIGAIIYFFFYPPKFTLYVPPPDGSSGINFCRELITDPDAPTVVAPSYDLDHSIHPEKLRTYRLIKRNVPVLFGTFAFQNEYEHILEGYKAPYEDPKTKEKYIVRLPGGGGGVSYSYSSDINNGMHSYLEFAKYGILYMVHADENYQPTEINDPNPKVGRLYLIDIYKAIDTPPLPPDVLTCVDTPPPGGDTPTVVKAQGGETFAWPVKYQLYYPKQNWSPSKAEEQLNWFLPQKLTYINHAWWVPHCKPAIYLYPEKEQKVNVQVAIPQGEFLYTDPVYPTGGWNVRAQPNGDLLYLGKNLADSKGKVNYASGVFPYMYYEARIADAAIEKPATGFVKKSEELAHFFDETLPRLGLNEKESREFKEYWLKALPKSPYYFIGIMPQEQLNINEPLTITPQQDTMIRVRLYFEALDKRQSVKEPEIQTPTRDGFTVVDWGGMVKTDKNHPFTCLQ